MAGPGTPKAGLGPWLVQGLAVGLGPVAPALQGPGLWPRALLNTSILPTLKIACLEQGRKAPGGASGGEGKSSSLSLVFLGTQLAPPGFMKSLGWRGWQENRLLLESFQDYGGSAQGNP